MWQELDQSETTSSMGTVEETVADTKSADTVGSLSKTPKRTRNKKPRKGGDTMSVYLRCPRCGKTSRKDESSGRFEDFTSNDPPPESTVIQRQCPCCIRRNEAGLPSLQLATSH